MRLWEGLSVTLPSSLTTPLFAGLAAPLGQCNRYFKPFKDLTPNLPDEKTRPEK
jgi:hypothetical protein